MLQPNTSDVKKTAAEFAKIFAKNNWTWLDNKEPPNKYEIEEQILRYINRLNEDEDVSSVESGRIRVSRGETNESVTIILVADTQYVQTTEILKVETK